MQYEGEVVNRVIVMGSPRSDGRSAHLAEMLFEACIDECPEDELFLVPVSELDIAPCVGCGACRSMAPKGAAAQEVAAMADEAADGEAVGPAEGGAADGDADEEPTDYPYCPRFDDDMQDVYALLPGADELIVVSPVYFSGAPSSMKALLDRMQPHFWADSRKAPKRPATLHVVGEGGDPHGYDALISEVKSSLACAGFRLERVLDWVGKIAADGEIEEEATEVPLVKKPSLVSVADAPAASRTDAPERPKLDLGGRFSSGKGRPTDVGSKSGGSRRQSGKADRTRKNAGGSANPASSDAGSKRIGSAGKVAAGASGRGNGASGDSRKGRGKAGGDSGRRGSGSPRKGSSDKGGARGKARRHG